jgi:hypothetical protein
VIRLRLGRTLTKPASGSENIDMRTSRALLLIALLAVLPICVFGDQVVFYPNPVGEKVYRRQLFIELLPGAIIVCLLLLAWLVHVIRRKPRTLMPDTSGSYDI